MPRALRYVAAGAEIALKNAGCDGIRHIRMSGT